MTLGELDWLVRFLVNVYQLGWWRTPTRGSPSQLLKLGMEQIINQGSSWMNIMSYRDWVSRIVLIIYLFFLMFWEKNFRTLQFIERCCSQLNGLSSTCFHRSWYIFWYAIHDGTYVSRMGIHLSLLSDLHDSWGTWKNVGTDCLLLFWCKGG